LSQSQQDEVIAAVKEFVKM